MSEAAGVPGFRLAELVAAISQATDLGTGQPMEHALRTCLLSMAVADELGLDPSTADEVYYVALLRFLGCTADAPETAQLVGGDNTFDAQTFFQKLWSYDQVIFATTESRRP